MKKLKRMNSKGSKSMLLPTAQASRLKTAFKKINELFTEDYLLKKIKADDTKNSTLEQCLFIWLLKHTAIDSLSDFELIMLCGRFDYVFVAGNSPFTADQTKMINEVNDIIFTIKHEND